MINEMKTYSTYTPSLADLAPYKADDANIKNLSNATYIQKTTVDVSATIKNQSILVDHAQNNTVALDARNPDLTMPTVEADPVLRDKAIAISLASAAMPVPEKMQVMVSPTKDADAQSDNNSFSIVSINTGHGGRLSNTLQDINDVQLQARKSTTESANMSRELAHSHNKQATEKSIDAAKTQTTMAVSQGIMSSAMAVGGGIRSAQGIKTQSNAITINGKNAMDHKHKAAALDTQRTASNPTKTDSTERAHDTERLGQTPEDLRTKAESQTLHQQERTLAGQNQQNQGQIATASANGMAAAMVAPGHTAIAVDQGASSNEHTNSEVLKSLSEEQRALADHQARFKDVLLELQQKMSEGRNSTASVIASNIKG